MQKNSIILLESNSAILGQMKEILKDSEDFSLLYYGEDGDEGIKQILEHKPNVVVVSMFLKGADGYAVMQSIRKISPNTKIIATGIANDSLIERAMREGAVYYLVKPFSVVSAIERIREILSENAPKIGQADIVKKKAVSMDEKISEIFVSIGIPPHIKGYAYLREGIKMTVDDPCIINRVTKELYPGIAQKYDTSPSKVERAIRHAIEVAWNRGRIEAINAVFGARIYLGTEKPTNSEFIALMADKLILENFI